MIFVISLNAKNQNEKLSSLEIDLPVSISKKRPCKKCAILFISKDSVYFDNIAVISINKLSKTPLLNKNTIIPELVNVLGIHYGNEHNENLKKNISIKFCMDKSIKFCDICKLMNTVVTYGIGKIEFVVNKKNKNKLTSISINLIKTQKILYLNKRKSKTIQVFLVITDSITYIGTKKENIKIKYNISVEKTKNNSVLNYSKMLDSLKKTLATIKTKYSKYPDINNIIIAPDKNITYNQVIQIMDIAHMEDFVNISIAIIKHSKPNIITQVKTLLKKYSPIDIKRSTSIDTLINDLFLK